MKLDHISIMLSKLPEQIPFYQTLLPMLGFEETKPYQFKNQDQMILDFRQAQEPERGYYRYAPGLNHLGFNAPSVDAVHDIRHNMLEAGFDAPQVQEFDNGIAIFMKDDDGMRIEIGYTYPQDST